MAAVPASPSGDERAHLLAVLAELIARGGAARFCAPPVEPGREAFPEPWTPTARAVHELLARLAWHAGLERGFEVRDQRLGAPPTERRPTTVVEVVEVDRKTVTVSLDLIGRDDIAGTLAHEIGVAFAALHRPPAGEPFREAEARDRIEIDADLDLERGSIAAVYVGLGVLAANAAFQQYTGDGRFNGAFVPLEYDVLRAGYAPMPWLAFLLAVQAVIAGQTTAPPGLSPPQRDEVSDWIAALRDQRETLTVELGLDRAGSSAAVASTSTVAAAIAWRSASPRPPLAALDLPPPSPHDATEPAADADREPPRIAFRWRSNRAGVGFLAGTVFGVGAAALIASRAVSPWFALGGAAAGVTLGRRVPVPRCTACATVVAAGAPSCPQCGAQLCDDIAHRADRLDAEERWLARSTGDFDASRDRAD